MFRPSHFLRLYLICSNFFLQDCRLNENDVALLSG